MNELTELNRGFLNSNNNKHRCIFNVGYAVSVYSKQFYKIKKYSLKYSQLLCVKWNRNVFFQDYFYF